MLRDGRTAEDNDDLDEALDRAMNGPRPLDPVSVYEQLSAIGDDVEVAVIDA